MSDKYKWPVSSSFPYPRICQATQEALAKSEDPPGCRMTSRGDEHTSIITKSHDPHIFEFGMLRKKISEP